MSEKSNVGLVSQGVGRETDRKLVLSLLCFFQINHLFCYRILTNHETQLPDP